MWRKVTVADCFAVVVLLLLGHELIASARDERVIVDDALGRKIEVILPVKSLVALNSDVLEVVRALKAEDLVSGVYSEITREPDLWPGLKDRPKVGSWRDPNIEVIAQLKPDIVIAYGRNPGQELEKRLSPFGIKALRLDLYKIGKLEKEVKTLGLILDRKTEAERLCSWHRKKMDMISETLIGINDRPDVYIESYTKNRMSGPGTGIHEMCVMAGGHNIASDFTIPYAEVAPEWVVTKDPEIIIKGASWSAGYIAEDSTLLDRIRDEVIARPAWNHIRAVSRGKVHVMDSSVWTGPRAIIGICYMAKWFHPEEFKDIDPQALHREYMEVFQGIKFRGVYVCGMKDDNGRKTAIP